MGLDENNLGKMMYDENILKEMVELLTLTRDLIKISLEQIQGEGLNVNAGIF